MYILYIDIGSHVGLAALAFATKFPKRYTYVFFVFAALFFVLAALAFAVN